MPFTLAHLSKTIAPAPPTPPVENENLITDGTIYAVQFNMFMNEGSIGSYSIFLPSNMDDIKSTDCVWTSYFNISTVSVEIFNPPVTLSYTENAWKAYYGAFIELSGTGNSGNLEEITWVGPAGDSVSCNYLKMSKGDNYLKLFNTNTVLDNNYTMANVSMYPGDTYGWRYCTPINNKNTIIIDTEGIHLYGFNEEQNKLEKYFSSEKTWQEIMEENGLDIDNRIEPILITNTIKWIPVDGTPATAENQPKFEMLTVE